MDNYKRTFEVDQPDIYDFLNFINRVERGEFQWNGPGSFAVYER